MEQENKQPTRVQRIRPREKGASGYLFPAGKENDLPIVYVGRGSKWGNRFFVRDAHICFKVNDTSYLPLKYVGNLSESEQRKQLVLSFKRWLNGSKKFYGIWFVRSVKAVMVENNALPPSKEDIKSELKGKNLACWCKFSEVCHAEILIEIANE